LPLIAIRCDRLNLSQEATMQKRYKSGGIEILKCPSAEKNKTKCGEQTKKRSKSRVQGSNLVAKCKRSEHHSDDPSKLSENSKIQTANFFEHYQRTDF